MEQFNSPLDFSQIGLTDGLEGSLRRIDTDYIDLYQLHNPPVELLKKPENLQELFTAWKTSGKIRALGISVKTPDEALMAIDHFDLDSIQLNFSLIDQRCLADDLFAVLLDKGVSIIARTPLCFGFLTGLFSAESAFLPGDHRSRWSADQINLWVNALIIYRDVISHYPESSPAQFALRYCLSYDAVVTTIPGMLNIEHVNDNIGGSDQGALCKADLDLLENLYKSTSFFIGET
jgi:aryl-alcohol dehydrogenase-like predicted oxidoreductase